MLGTVRYILALMVACSHIWQQLLWWQGIYAVFCFYVISGYLMSMVLNEVYHGTDGTMRYVANRVLRIYPAYLIVLVLTALATSYLTQYLQQPFGYGYVLSDFIGSPGNLRAWLANLSLVYGFPDALAVSQTWSLRVELVFYLIMIFLVRRFSTVLAWFVLSAAYVLYQNYIGVEFEERYTSVLGSSIAFSAGALIYHAHLKYPISKLHIPMAAALFIIHLVCAPYLWGFPANSNALLPSVWQQNLGIYPNLLIFAYLLYGLCCREKSAGRLHSIGEFLGKIAYSIFLLHWLIALLVLSAGIAFSDKWSLVPAIFVALNIAAVALYQLIERPVERHFRDKLRGSAGAVHRVA
ncbi:MAG: acyltransferase [Halioglobus sp.]